MRYWLYEGTKKLIELQSKRAFFVRKNNVPLVNPFSIFENDIVYYVLICRALLFPLARLVILCRCIDNSHKADDREVKGCR